MIKALLAEVRFGCARVLATHHQSGVHRGGLVGDEVLRHPWRVRRSCRSTTGVAWNSVHDHNGPALLYKLLKKPGCDPAFFLPEIQAIAFPQTQLIPPTELLPLAFNVPMRPVALPSISLPLMIFLAVLFYWMD